MPSVVSDTEAEFHPEWSDDIEIFDLMFSRQPVDSQRSAGTEVSGFALRARPPATLPAKYLACVRDLGAILEQIRSLLAGEGIEGDDIPPTNEVVERVVDLLSESCFLLLSEMPKRQIPFHFPLGHVVNDPFGGIRIEWENASKKRSLRLVVPTEDRCKEYLYFRDGESHGTEAVGHLALAKRLIWINS
jgi:hypothetical protein